MKTLILLGSVLALLAFGALLLAKDTAAHKAAMDRKLTEHKEPPPGWTVVCDGAGHYGAQFPGGGFVIGDDLQEHLMTNRQWAIERAWEQYEYEKIAPPEEMPQSVWHDCEGSDTNR